MFTVFKLLFLVLFARKWEVSADLIALGPGTLHLISSDEMPLTKQQMDSSRFSEHTYTFKQVQVWKNEGWFTDGGNSVHRLLKLRFFKVTLTFLWKNVAPLPSVGQRRHIMYHVRATVCRNAHVCLHLCLSFSVLLSPATYCEQLGPSAGAKAVRSTTFSAVVLEPFLSDHGLLECVWTPPTSPPPHPPPLALLSLDITCIALRVARPAMPLDEKWISPNRHHHGDAQLTRQFCPFKDLHRRCRSDGELRNVGTTWFHPLVSVPQKNASWIFDETQQCCWRSKRRVCVCVAAFEKISPFFFSCTDTPLFFLFLGVAHAN